MRRSLVNKHDWYVVTYVVSCVGRKKKNTFRCCRRLLRGWTWNLETTYANNYNNGRLTERQIPLFCYLRTVAAALPRGLRLTPLIHIRIYTHTHTHIPRPPCAPPPTVKFFRVRTSRPARPTDGRRQRRRPLDCCTFAPTVVSRITVKSVRHSCFLKKTKATAYRHLRITTRPVGIRTVIIFIAIIYFNSYRYCLFLMRII